ncbi:hypothetical protein [Gordonibacter pamelaeae]|uniref:hypothetical protein n=1 Tax=Gordonibacter pamelaeae TaxID=471189 RepID=UPI003A901CBC
MLRRLRRALQALLRSTAAASLRRNRTRDALQRPNALERIFSIARFFVHRFFDRPVSRTRLFHAVVRRARGYSVARDSSVQAHAMFHVKHLYVLDAPLRLSGE